MHKGLELFSYLNLKDRTYSRLEPSTELNPARISFFFEGGQRNVSACCQQSFFGILLNGSILPFRLF